MLEVTLRRTSIPSRKGGGGGGVVVPATESEISSHSMAHRPHAVLTLPYLRAY